MKPSVTQERPQRLPGALVKLATDLRGGKLVPTL